MTLATFGALHIEVTPTAANPKIFNVDIGCEHRKETVSMTTNPEETIDQFAMRIKSMLRALVNGEPRVLEEEKIPPEPKKTKSWIEQKIDLVKGSHA